MTRDPLTASSSAVDPRAPRFGQALTGGLLAVALPLDVWWLVPVVGLVLAGGALLGPRFNLWGQLYRVTVRPFLPAPAYLKPAAPTRFANLVGFVFLAVATTLVLLGGTASLVGWALAAAVAALALLAAATDYCVGCKMYGLILRVPFLAPRRT